MLCSLYLGIYMLHVVFIILGIYLVHVVFIIPGDIYVACCVHYTWGYICCMLCSLYLGIYMVHVFYLHVSYTA